MRDFGFDHVRNGDRVRVVLEGVVQNVATIDDSLSLDTGKRLQLVRRDPAAVKFELLKRPRRDLVPGDMFLDETGEIRAIITSSGYYSTKYKRNTPTTPKNLNHPQFFQGWELVNP